MSPFRLALPLLLTSVAAAPAFAGTIIFDTLGQPAVDANFVGTPQLIDCTSGNPCVTVAGGTWAEDPANPGNPWNHGGAGAVAQSFHVPTATQITSLSFGLSAWAPGSTETFRIYLLKDAGGSATQSSGPIPTSYPAPNGAVSDLSAGILIGTLSDAALTVDAKGPHVVTLDNLAVPVAPGEYWIGMISDFGAYSLWWYNADATGIGTAGQNSFAFDAKDGTYQTYAASLGAYQMTVEVPEPGALTLLGVGMVGLGLVSRRPAGGTAHRHAARTDRISV